ncbi:hypothetical protein D9758_018290 [Tetrapyrgos nigripes]|uniref:Uncharacterized protein n=1 Tax=Tetrapyrgos nigripes TaxID=182062 RepID=A0A8H5EZH9_9AGAR|nr:hypothetical protein D9758_018290 [Tetrapyrgos nigripes]
MVLSLVRTTTTATRSSLGGKKAAKTVKTVQPRILGRLYHDESFGYRKPPAFAFPDYTEARRCTSAGLASSPIPASAFQSHALRKRMHGLLARSEVFVNFLYCLEGGEFMLPALDSLFSAAARTRV